MNEAPDNMIVSVLALVEVIPPWSLQILGAFVLTQVIMQVFKAFEPGCWGPYKRRKINLALSIVVGGGSIIYLYDQDYKDFVIITFMFGNNFLYSGLARLVEAKAKSHNGWWTVANAFFRPYAKKRKTYLQKHDNIIKEKDVDTDATVMMHVVQTEDKHE